MGAQRGRLCEADGDLGRKRGRQAMMELTLLLVAAAVAFGISRGLRIPVVPLLIAVGYVLSLLEVTPDRQLIEQLLELGLSFLVFTAGMELHPGRIGKRYKAVFAIGTLQFFVLGGAGLGVALFLRVEPMGSVSVGLAMRASATLVVMRLRRMRQQMFEPFGRLVIGVLLFQDILVILFMVLLAQSAAGWMGMASGAGATLVMVP